MEQAIAEMILMFVAKYPITFAVLAVIGTMRAVNKPLFALLRAYVLSTASVKDDMVLDQVESSKAYKTISFALDYLASVKLPKAK